VNLLGDYIIGHSKQKLYIQVPYSERFPRESYFMVQFQIVDKKEIICTVSNTGICCASVKVGTVYLV
jgi:hypothetical protein